MTPTISELRAIAEHARVQRRIEQSWGLFADWPKSGASAKNVKNVKLENAYQAHIVDCSPETIIALLDKLEHTQQELAKAQQAVSLSLGLGKMLSEQRAAFDARRDARRSEILE